MPTTKKPPGGGSGGTQFRYVGYNAIVLEGGTPLAPGDYITLDAEGMTAHQDLIDDGKLIDATGFDPGSAEAQAQSQEAPASEEASA
jgi:hypothetical protein